MITIALIAKRDSQDYWKFFSADMSYIFYETDVQELDVSTWDVSSVTTFAFSFSTFGGHSDDVSFPDLSLWKTSSALTLESMFEFCQYHTNETDFTNWDVGKYILEPLYCSLCVRLSQYFHCPEQEM